MHCRAVSRDLKWKVTFFDEFIRFQWSTLRRRRSPSANKLLYMQLKNPNVHRATETHFSWTLVVIKENVQLLTPFTPLLFEDKPSAALMSHSLCLQMPLMRCVMTKMIWDAWCFHSAALAAIKMSGREKKEAWSRWERRGAEMKFTLKGGIFNTWPHPEEWARRCVSALMVFELTMFISEDYMILAWNSWPTFCWDINTVKIRLN